MDSYKLKQLLDGIKIIGDKINQWQNHSDIKKIHDQKELKTEADYKANQLIKKLIRDVDKGAKIISEEDTSFDVLRPDSYWLIDPIDGTASWLEGYKGFVTQVAFVSKGTPFLGIVYAPALYKMWWAQKGEGAYLNGELIHKKNRNQNDGFSLTDNYPKPQRIAKTIFEGFKVKKYIESGSLGLKSVMVADGTADLFVKDIVFRDWDIAPASVILNELGCHMSDISGQQIAFTGSYENKEGLLVASDAELAKKIVDFIRQRGA